MNINEVLKSDYDLLCKDYKKATKKIEKQDNEIKSLKEQLEYLRSNEYLNQVKWERDINEKLNNTYKLVIEKQDKEIERLNNIINELERDMNNYYEEYKDVDDIVISENARVIKIYLDKLKDLKENK